MAHCCKVTFFGCNENNRFSFSVCAAHRVLTLRNIKAGSKKLAFGTVLHGGDTPD
jgi:hypothetical protein